VTAAEKSLHLFLYFDWKEARLDGSHAAGASLIQSIKESYGNAKIWQF
jgi:hypothetical protein